MCFLLHVTPPVPQAKMLFFTYLSLAWITFSHNTFFGLDTVREKKSGAKMINFVWPVTCFLDLIDTKNSQKHK